MDESLRDSWERVYERRTDGCHQSPAFISSDLHPTDLGINHSDRASDLFDWTEPPDIFMLSFHYKQK